jgi:hypothetical protein
MIRLLVILLVGALLCTSQAIAHTFFVGSTEILVNEHTKSIEVIHRFTSHDLEAMLSDRNQVSVDADSEEYSKMVSDYVTNGFSLTDKDGKQLPLVLVGIEAGVNETFIYQEVEGLINIKGVIVAHRLLTDYFPNQKNRVNFESPATKGSLLFDNNIQKLKIK